MTRTRVWDVSGTLPPRLDRLSLCGFHADPLAVLQPFRTFYHDGIAGRYPRLQLRLFAASGSDLDGPPLDPPVVDEEHHVLPSVLTQGAAGNDETGRDGRVAALLLLEGDLCP